MSKPTYIVAAKDGWEPSRQLIARLQVKAKRLGLISDWDTVCALANHDLLLDCSHVTGEHGADIVAVKEGGRWVFRTDGEVVSVAGVRGCDAELAGEGIKKGLISEKEESDMPRSFPDMKSLEQSAGEWNFRTVNPGESEEEYRNALADFVSPKDFIESQEIRNKVGWDQWDDRQNKDMLFRSALRSRKG